MEDVTNKLSETSVTILGIFSGIVLTVVAGLFYSSSVLENINAANFYRLLCIAALVGLVCYHLIIVMFRFIERIGKNNCQESPSSFFSNKTTIFITIVLIIIMISGAVLQFVFPERHNFSEDSTGLSGETSMDTNVVSEDVSERDLIVEDAAPEDLTTEYAISLQ